MVNWFILLHLRRQKMLLIKNKSTQKILSFLFPCFFHSHYNKLPQNLILNWIHFYVYIKFWKYILYLGILWQKQNSENIKQLRWCLIQYMDTKIPHSLKDNQLCSVIKKSCLPLSWSYTGPTLHCSLSMESNPVVCLFWPLGMHSCGGATQLVTSDNAFFLHLLSLSPIDHGHAIQGFATSPGFQEDTDLNQGFTIPGKVLVCWEGF